MNPINIGSCRGEPVGRPPNRASEQVARRTQRVPIGHDNVVAVADMRHRIVIAGRAKEGEAQHSIRPIQGDAVAAVEADAVGSQDLLHANRIGVAWEACEVAADSRADGVDGDGEVVEADHSAGQLADAAFGLIKSDMAVNADAAVASVDAAEIADQRGQGIDISLVGEDDLFQRAVGRKTVEEERLGDAFEAQGMRAGQGGAVFSAVFVHEEQVAILQRCPRVVDQAGEDWVVARGTDGQDEAGRLARAVIAANLAEDRLCQALMQVACVFADDEALAGGLDDLSRAELIQLADFVFAIHSFLGWARKARLCRRGHRVRARAQRKNFGEFARKRLFRVYNANDNWQYCERAMPTIIFRDDDTSYFTTPQRLETVYGRVLEAGLPVCLAVIPAVFGDARVYWTDGNPHDPGIPPAFRGTPACYSVLENRELCAFLNELAAQGLVEICLHGYTHAFYEFITHDRAVIQRKLDAGLALLERAFPAARVKTFIAPYDRLSPVALEQLIAGGFHISTMSLNLAPLSDLPQIVGFAAGEIRRGQMLYICDDYLFSYKRAPAESLKLARSALAGNALTIISNHYWMFFHPWRDEPNPADMAAWNAFLDDVLAADGPAVTSFSAFAARVSAGE